MMKRIGVIYLITNKINGKMYVGSTTGTIQKRWREHRCLAKTKTDIYLYRAMNKHGEKNFKIEEICTVLDISFLNATEEYFINLFNTYQPKGYNLINPNRTEDLAKITSAYMLKAWADPEIRKRREKSNQKAGESQAIPIVAVSIYDGSIKFYDRVHDARRDGFSVSSIYSALNEQAKTGQKQCWFYKTVEDTNFYKKAAMDLIGSFKHDFLLPIEGTNVQTGEKIYFDNCEDLTNKGWKPKNIRRVIKGERIQYGGYYWKFKV